MNKYLNILCLAGLFATSCVREELPVEAERKSADLIQISGAYSSPQTKTILNGLSTSWKNLDKTGIYCAQAKNPGGLAGVKNAEFTALTQTISSYFDGSIFWGREYMNFIPTIHTAYLIP